MSLATMLSTEAVIHRFTPGVQDRYGNATDAWTADAGPTRCRIWPTQSSERTDRRNTQIADHESAWPAGTALHGRDRVVTAYGVTFEVVGPALPRTDPRGAHHVQAALRHVEG